jgi:hypothetical protein
MRSIRVGVAVVVSVMALAGGRAEAQPFGTFRWQQQPYCNVIQVDIVVQGALYKLDGFDDQCGAATRAAVTGLAFPNPDGSVGFGLTIVTTPGSTPVHLTARLLLPSISGTWASEGQTGAWTFVAAAGTGGSPRPPPPPFTISGGFSVNGGVISSLGTPTAAGDATPKSYVDAQDAANRTYADTQDAADRSYARTIVTAPVTPLLYGARLVSGSINTYGCAVAEVSANLSVSHALAIPAGATLTAVRLTYFRGPASSGSLTMTVWATDLASGTAVTTALASRVVSAPSAPTFTTDTLSLPTPLVVTGTKRIYVQVAGPDTSTFCGGTPIFTVP